AEEQPVATRCLDGLSFMQEGTEWRDAGAGADHDDRFRLILWQREMLRLLQVDTELAAGRDAAAEECRANAKARALVDLVAHRIDRERNTTGMRFGRRGDRIDARLQRIERLDEGFGVGPNAGKFVQRREHIERAAIAVRVLAGGKPPRLLLALA